MELTPRSSPPPNPAIARPSSRRPHSPPMPQAPKPTSLTFRFDLPSVRYCMRRTIPDGILEDEAPPEPLPPLPPSPGTPGEGRGEGSASNTNSARSREWEGEAGEAPSEPRVTPRHHPLHPRRQQHDAQALRPIRRGGRLLLRDVQDVVPV